VVAIGIRPFVIGTPNGATAFRGTLEAMKKQETVWLTDAESVVQASSVIDEANGPIAMRPQRVCHDTLPWLISVSLDELARLPPQQSPP